MQDSLCPFSIFSSGGHFVKPKGTILAILVKDNKRNISVKFRVRVTDPHCRHLRRKIKFGTKNRKLAKTSGEKNILPELPATEPYNCRTCLSHRPWLNKSPINNSIIGQKTVKLTWIWWKRYKITCRDAQFDSSTAHFPSPSSSIFMMFCRNYQSGVASPTSRKFTKNVTTWNSMSNTNMENKLITREIIIVINRFGLC